MPALYELAQAEPRRMTTLEKLGQTWPVRMGKSVLSALALPGDVWSGRTQPGTDDYYNRATDLAGLAMSGGTLGGVRGAALGSGPVRKAGKTWTQNTPGSKIKKDATGTTAFSTTPIATNTAQRGASGSSQAHSPRNLPVKPASEDIYETLDATFQHGRVLGNKTMPIEKLRGGVSAQATEARRVDELAEAMAGPDGYIRRLIVDAQGNVVEGQHRLAALQKLGVDEVPVHVIEDLTAGLDMGRVNSAASNLGLHGDQKKYLVQNALEMAREAGSGADALKQFDIPKDWAAAYRAILTAIDGE